MDNHNFYPKSKIDFINHIEADESVGREFNQAAQIMSDTELAEYNRQYDSTLHRDNVWNSGRKDWNVR